MQFLALTGGEEIPTGTAVVVLGVLTPQSVEVARAEITSPLPLEGPAHV